jgi:hypothetical protein
MKPERRRVSSDMKLNACYSLPRRPTSDEQMMPAGEDLLMELAALIEPDGGMPGKDDDQRLIASLLALLCFATNGHTPASGSYRRHVKRLGEFINQTTPGPNLPATPREMVEAILLHGPAFPDWKKEARRLMRNPGQCTARRWTKIYTNLSLASNQFIMRTVSSKNSREVSTLSLRTTRRG